MSSSTSDVSQLRSIGISQIQRLLPEPKSRLGQIFSRVLNGAVGSVRQMSGIDPGYQELINAQLEAQRQMQLVSLVSNIEKSKHETEMVAIRNIRVG